MQGALNVVAAVAVLIISVMHTIARSCAPSLISDQPDSTASGPFLLLQWS